MNTDAIDLATEVRNYFAALDSGRPYPRAALEAQAARILCAADFTPDNLFGFLSALNAEAAAKYQAVTPPINPNLGEG